jgi:predicted RND superfamily exporter protein
VKKISAFTVKYYLAFFLLFALCLVYCILCIKKVNVDSDLRHFLPDEAETRRGIEAMNGEFKTYASLRIMLEGVTQEEAAAFASELGQIPHVLEASFSDDATHYKDGDALINVSFDGQRSDDGIQSAMNEVSQAAGKYKSYISGDILGNYSSVLAKEMKGVIAIAAVVIFIVLLITSRSYFEVFVYLIVFVVSAILNKGTNFWLGTISSITDSVGIILQLALAIDYAIIFAHRYQDEAAIIEDRNEALIISHARSMREIASSSLTTISGLAALTLMTFRLGRDLGLVLGKSIICSMLTVFLLMPGLIRLFAPLIKKTTHKKLVPDISFWGRFLAKRRFVFVVIFALILPAAFIFSQKTEFAFSDGSVTEIIESESRTARKKINERFGNLSASALIIPEGDFEKQREIASRIEELSGTASVTALAQIKVTDDLYITDSVGAGDLARILGADSSQTELLVKGYALKNGNLKVLVSDAGDLKYPFCDLMMFLLENIENGAVSLSEKQQEMLGSLGAKLKMAVEQLRGSRLDRIAFMSTLPAEGTSSEAYVEEIRNIAKEYYKDEDIIIAGDITSARDLKASYESDSLKISLLTAGFVFVILLITFKDPLTAIIMVFVIQGSIWINFSCSYICQDRSSFVTHMIVSAIQMGATIDYAIVFMSRYMSAKKNYDNKEAVTVAINECFPTVLTSGLIMTVAGLLIAYRVSDVYVGHIGLAVGRGAAISILLVLTVLPQLTLIICPRDLSQKLKMRPRDGVRVSK